MNGKMIQQFLIGVLTLLVGKGVATAGAIYATVLRMEVMLDENSARTSRINDQLNEQGRDMIVHERRITILEHNKGG